MTESALELGLVQLSSKDRRLGERALSNARGMVAHSLGKNPEDVSDGDIVEAYQKGGFQDWDADMADRVVRMLAQQSQFEHI